MAGKTYRQFWELRGGLLGCFELVLANGAAESHTSIPLTFVEEGSAKWQADIDMVCSLQRM